MLAELQNDCLVLFGSKAAVCLEHFCSIVIKARSWGMWKLFHDRLSSALKPFVMLGITFHFFAHQVTILEMFLLIMSWIVLLNTSCAQVLVPGSYSNMSCSLRPSHCVNSHSCSFLKMESSLLLNPVMCLENRREVVGRGGVCFIHGTKQHPPGEDLMFVPLEPAVSHGPKKYSELMIFALCFSGQAFGVQGFSFSLLIAVRTVTARLLLAPCRSWYPWGAPAGPAAASLVFCHVEIPPHGSPGLPVASPESSSVPPQRDKTLCGGISLAAGCGNSAPCQPPVASCSALPSRRD